MGTPPIQMANLGMADTLIIMVIALVVFGPRRLPQIGRQIGKLMYEFRKASNDFKFQMEEELRSAEEADRRKKEEDRLKALALAAPTQTEPVTVLPTTAAAEPAIAPVSADPYAAETLYPPEPLVTPPAGTEENLPLIQPPSTGEQIAAAPPNSAAIHTATQPALDFSAAPEALPAETGTQLVEELPQEQPTHHG
jgi:sec-independent protein translocase protein TatB